jgi:hypothetical protein
MQDMIAIGETWFRSQRREHLATEVSYQPTVGPTRTVLATIVVGRWESVDAAGQIMRTETRDFLVDTTDLAQDPKRGDKLVYGGATYEVTIPPGAEHHWRWSDRNQTLRRIHTMVISGGAATPGVPGPPTAVSGVDGSPVTWTAPVVLAEYAVTSYKVYIDDVLQETVAAPSTETSEPWSAGNVVRVSAVNVFGEGAKSSPATIAPTVPGAPTIIGSGASNQFQVTWTTPNNGGSPLTGYKLYQNGVQVEPGDPGTGWITTSLNDYFPGSVIRVSAVNAVGEGPLSDPVTVA